MRSDVQTINASFAASARTVDLLGRQQIAGIPTAIQELVKNSYDALASHVGIEYFEESNSLIIWDDGSGMSQDDFVKKWLTLGTSSRVEEAKQGTSAFKRRMRLKRPVTGEKGIGRLSVAAIGKMVLVVSHYRHVSEVLNEVRDQFVVSAVHWGAFEIPNITLEAIKVPISVTRDFPTQDDVRSVYEQLRSSAYDLLRLTGDPRQVQQIELDISAAERSLGAHMVLLEKRLSKSTGTAFAISNVDRVFGSDLDQSKDSMDGDSAILQTLTGFSDALRGNDIEQKFNLSVLSHKADGTVYNYSLEDNFFNAEDLRLADHRFEGRFDEDGNFNGDIYIFGKLVKSGYKIECLRNDKVKKLKCGPFDFSLGYVQGNQRQSAMDAMDHQKLSQKLRRFGGLYIYRDGIRLLPYGRSDYDFLGIESDRIKSASRYFFSYHRMFGSIAITKEKNGALQEKAGREGLVENAAYREFKSVLKTFFRRVAAEFFTEHPEHDESASRFWAEHRRYLESLSKLSKDREKAFDRKRAVFKKKLANFFKLQGDRYFKKLADEILDSLVNQLYDEKAPLDQQRRELSHEVVLRYQHDAYERLTDLEKSVTIKYPVGVSLELEQREDWDAYLRLSEQVMREVIVPSKARLSAIIGNYDAGMRILKPGESLEEEIVTEALENAKGNVTRQLKQVEVLIDDLKRRFVFWKESSIQQYERQVQDTLGRVRDIEHDTERDINKSIVELLNKVSPTVENIEKVVDYVKGQILPIRWEDVGGSGVVTSQEILAAVQEENQDLKRQRLSDVELVQLGLAVRAFHHEFNGSVIQARRAIKRLAEESRNDERYKELSNTISSSFAHLEQYISMMTPFAERVDNVKEDIAGLEVAQFLYDAFRATLKRVNARIVSTVGFEKHTIRGHRSVLFPVMFNLVDNALYWLSRSDATDRVVLLHANKDGEVSVSNNGDPIAINDRERIFAMGFSRKIGGRGMGLAISREILAKEQMSISCIDPVRNDMTVSFVIRELQDDKDLDMEATK